MITKVRRAIIWLNPRHVEPTQNRFSKDVEGEGGLEIEAGTIVILLIPLVDFAKIAPNILDLLLEVLFSMRLFERWGVAPGGSSIEEGGSLVLVFLPQVMMGR